MAAGVGVVLVLPPDRDVTADGASFDLNISSGRRIMSRRSLDPALCGEGRTMNLVAALPHERKGRNMLIFEQSRVGCTNSFTGPGR